MRWDARITLSDTGTGSADISYARGIENKEHFFYTDAYDGQVEVFLDKDGITMFRQGEDHLTELYHHASSYIRVTGEEGEIRFDIKVLAFIFNDDILSMRYLIEDDEKVLEIQFIRSSK